MIRKAGIALLAMALTACGAPSGPERVVEPRNGTASAQRGSALLRQVGQQRVAPPLLVDALADMAVEVAIRTFRDAERPMDV